MDFLLFITIGSLIVSFIFDSAKTKLALKKSFKKLQKLVPAFFTMLILIAIVLYLFSDEQLQVLFNNKSIEYSMILALVTGSIAFLPGFIAFPLCGVLLSKGVSYMVLSAFTTSLMMVGIVTFPLERAFLGTGLTILRNLFSLLIAVVVAVFTGILFGEIL